MNRFNQDELAGLVESLRDQPGFITAAVVPAGSGDALIERLRRELGDLEIEVAAHRIGPVNLGAQAAQLGQIRAGCVFILRLDEPGLFNSEDEALRFWRELNYQREALGSGTVRTCLLLSEETERGLALVADDLWDWTTIFRFPEAIRASVRTPADSEALVWSDHDDYTPPSESDLAILRSQWQRARAAELPHPTFIESYVVPLFLALPRSHDAEAIRLWKRDLHSGEAIDRLPPETSLLVARKMMYLARLGDSESHREDLIQGALAAADGAVAILERKATIHPEAFAPGLAAALSTSAKLQQDADRFEAALSQIEKCLDLLRRLAAAEGGIEAILKRHVQRQWALLFLLRARDRRGLPLLEHVEALRAMQDPSLDDNVRSNALGAALEISLTQPEQPVPQANACLFTAWLLSHDSRLEGPPLEQVLAHDPVSYCRSLEALLQLTPRTPWKKLLIEPLIREWATNGPGCPSLGKELVGWLLHFWNLEATDDGEDQESEDRLRSWFRLQWLAIRVLGYRYEPDFLRVFCRYLGSLSELGGHRRHRAVLYLGFMLRWSYQERALRPLAEIATDPECPSAELEAARDLANALRQAELPDVLRRESRSEPRTQEESFADQLKRGQPGLLRRFSPEEFRERGPHWGIAELAGDPEVPDLSREDLLALEGGLRALIRTGRVRDDGGGSSHEGFIFDAWIPWLARGSPRNWWTITTELIERQIDLPAPQLVLRRFPVLGIWPKGQFIAKKIEEKVALATGQGGEKLRENVGLFEYLRWALHLEDAAALLRCLETLTKEKEYTDFCQYQPIPWIMRWALDRPTFEAAGERRRAALQDVERRLWFLVEWSFADRLSPEEALAWCKEVAPLAARWEDLRWMLVDQLARIDDPGALELLLGEKGVANPQDHETQRKVFSLVTWRHELDHLENRYPEFVADLTLTHRGTFLSEAGRTEELRQWGHDLFSRILEMLPHGVPTNHDLVFTSSRKALHRWAHLEPEAFLAAAEKIVASADALRFVGLEGPALLEAILIVWQDLEPLAAAEARAKLGAGGPWIRHTWSQNQVSVQVDALWDPEFSARSEHRALRLQWLRSCSSDRDVAQHALAARTNGMLSEVQSIGKELLSLDPQLERALGVSLLAWHPEGDRWLEPLLESDPSAWVRQHAEWAITVCRRDRLGRQIYREAVSAASWHEQQARFEQLIPLVLPTFSLWPVWEEEISELTKALTPRRRALLVDFSYRIGKKAQWKQIGGRDLEKFCRGEDISTQPEPGEEGPPWLWVMQSA